LWFHHAEQRILSHMDEGRQCTLPCTWDGMTGEFLAGLMV
jgi:hypothetical protein